MSDKKDPVEELIYFVMHVLPSIKSWGQAQDTLAAVLNTFFKDQFSREELPKNEIFLATFGIHVDGITEVVVEHMDDYLCFSFSEGDRWMTVPMSP